MIFALFTEGLWFYRTWPPCRIYPSQTLTGKKTSHQDR